MLNFRWASDASDASIREMPHDIGYKPCSRDEQCAAMQDDIQRRKYICYFVQVRWNESIPGWCWCCHKPQAPHRPTKVTHDFLNLSILYVGHNFSLFSFALSLLVVFLLFFFHYSHPPMLFSIVVVVVVVVLAAPLSHDETQSHWQLVWTSGYPSSPLLYIYNKQYILHTCC